MQGRIHPSIHPRPPSSTFPPVHSGSVTSHYPFVIHELFSRAQQHNTTQHPHSGRSLFCPLTNPETALWLSTRAPIKTKAPTHQTRFSLPYKLADLIVSPATLLLPFSLLQQPTIPPLSFFPRACSGRWGFWYLFFLHDSSGSCLPTVSFRKRKRARRVSPLPDHTSWCSIL